MPAPDAKALLDRLATDGLTLVAVEACTGGLLSDTLVAVPGASRTFKGAVVAYHDDVKTGLLGVSPRLIEQHGAVSAVVAEMLAHAARDRMGADVAVAVTGIAGPEGARPGKPVGTVWLVALGPRQVLTVHKTHLEGDRQAVRRQAVHEALALVWQNLEEAEKEGQVPVLEG